MKNIGTYLIGACIAILVGMLFLAPFYFDNGDLKQTAHAKQVNELVRIAEGRE